ncbi:hypothetical protein OK006_2983 [Actinobacteria bacterium OK006]|nr:hypothetical protein OK006_2983 [Actinobacteria bacterium OK006]
MRRPGRLADVTRPLSSRRLRAAASGAGGACDGAEWRPCGEMPLDRAVMSAYLKGGASFALFGADVALLA